MKKLFLFLFLISCTSANLNNNAQYENPIFDDNLTFDEFNDLLIEYVKRSPYPSLNK